MPFVRRLFRGGGLAAFIWKSRDTLPAAPWEDFHNLAGSGGRSEPQGVISRRASATSRSRWTRRINVLPNSVYWWCCPSSRSVARGADERACHPVIQ